jgi:hypothetical protein
MDSYIILLAWFFAMLIPEFMAADSNPHALRSLGTLPVVFIFSAFAFNYFIQRASKQNASLKGLVLSVVIFLLLVVGLFNPIKYFAFWSKTPEAARAFEKTVTNITDYAKIQPPQREVFVAVGNMQRVPPRLFNYQNPNFHDLHPVEIGTVQPRDPNNFVVIFTDYQKDSIIQNIESRFPGMQVRQFTDAVGSTFYTLSR